MPAFSGRGIGTGELERRELGAWTPGFLVGGGAGGLE